MRFLTASSGKQDLHRRDSTRAVRTWQQGLRNDPLERGCDLDAHLLLLWAGEDVDQAVDRRRGVLGVKRGEDEVAGLGRRERGRDRLQVAHLAEEDHVGVLAERAAERLGEADRIRADLPLVHDAALVAVQELDRVLDRHDVVLPRAVDQVDHRRERGRLSRPGRAGDEDETARLVGELLERRRDAELLERLQLRRDHSEGSAETFPLEIDVDTKAGQSRNRVRHVQLPLDLEVLLLLRRHHAIEQPLSVLRAEPAELLHPLELPHHAHGWLSADREVEV